MIKFSQEKVLLLHKLISEETGGSIGVRDEACLLYTSLGCPKLDEVDYTEKLTAIIAGNAIKSVTVVRMEVPCCGGIENAVKNALRASGKLIPWQVVTISTDGRRLE